MSHEQLLIDVGISTSLQPSPGFMERDRKAVKYEVSGGRVWGKCLLDVRGHRSDRVETIEKQH